MPGGPRLWAGNALGPVDSDDAGSPRSVADVATRRLGAVFLIAGAPAGEVLAGAGFALAGAAIPGAVGIAEERRRGRVEADSRRRVDLDETRPLAYLALVTGTRCAALRAENGPNRSAAEAGVNLPGSSVRRV